jgi:uncharacterized protein (DUF697 family)
MAKAEAAMRVFDTLDNLFRGRDFSKLTAAERDQAARDVVTTASFASCAAVAAPLPLSDLWLATPVHVAMVVGVGRVYGRKLNRSEGVQLFTELAAAAGASMAARRLWIAISKFLLPGIGGWVQLPYVFAVTWALGRMAMVYFETPDLDSDRLREKFGDFVAEGKKKFSYQAFKDFMKQSGQTGPEPKRPPARKPAAKKQRARVVDADAAADGVEASWGDGPTAPARPAARAAARKKATASGRARKPAAGRRGKRA